MVRPASQGGHLRGLLWMRYRRSVGLHEGACPVVSRHAAAFHDSGHPKQMRPSSCVLDVRRSQIKTLWWMLPAAAAGAACAAEWIARSPTLFNEVQNRLALLQVLFGWVDIGKRQAQAPALELQRKIEEKAIRALQRGTHHCAWEVRPRHTDTLLRQPDPRCRCRCCCYSC